MNVLGYCGTLLLSIAMAACSTKRTESLIKNSPAVASFMEAANRVEALLQQGNLPGFNKEDHGLIRSPGIELNSNTNLVLVYPREVSMQVEKAGEENVIYWLVLRKNEEATKWEIVEAWKTDSRGQRREGLIERR